METTPVTKARPSKKDRAVVVVPDTQAPVASESPGGTVLALSFNAPAEVITPMLHAPQGAPTADQPADGTPANVPADNAPAIESPAAATLPIDNSAAIVVPTAAQLAAADMLGAMNTAFLAYQKAIPAQIAAEFVAPDDDAVESRAMDYAKANNVKLRAAFAVVEAEIAAERAKFDADRASVAPVQQEWLRAALASVDTLRGGIVQLLHDAGGREKSASKRASTTKADGDSAPRDVKGGSEWIDRAPKLLKWANENGLLGFILVDQSAKGYKGTFHACQLHADGRWELLRYNPETYSVIPTGEYVKSPFYFNTDGLPISTHGGERPKYALSNDVMFGVLMLAKDGKTILHIDGINHAVNDGKTIKHYAMPTSVFKDAGVSFK